MADFVFNIALGHVNEYVYRVNNNDPTNSALIVVLLKADEADATLLDYDDLNTLLGAAGNTECDFTNYARKTLTDADLGDPTVDDSGDTKSSDMPDLTWSSAGGATNNNIVSLLVCYDNDTTGGTDANIIPLTKHDFIITTDGTDITATVPAAGFYTAT